MTLRPFDILIAEDNEDDILLIREAFETVKVLDKGVAINAKLYERLIAHKLPKPIEESLASSPEVTGAVLRQHAEDAMRDVPFFARIAEDAANASRLLDTLETMGLRWGIVTNKRMRFTNPLVEQLGLSPRTCCVVSGDTTAEPKPSALPVLHACQLLRCTPDRALYVGDDRRDIVAGRAAGCLTVAVSYGYFGDSGPLPSWGADLMIDHPADLSQFLTTRAVPR